MEQKMKHTPGPWVVDDVVSEDNAGQPTLGIYADGPEAYGYVCGIHCSPDAEITKQDYANAALIAAAPAMYEALQSILAEVTNDTDGLDTAELYEIIYFIRGKAKSALAQAGNKP